MPLDAKALRHVTFGESLPGAMVDTVDDNPLRFEFNAKDDPMREIDLMADFEGEFVVFRNQRTSLRSSSSE